MMKSISIRSSIVGLLVGVLMAFTMLAMLNSEAFARENSAPSVIKGGAVGNFAKYAPISTITIDRSKIHKDNLVFTEPGKLDQLPNSGSNITFTFADGYVYAEGVTVNADYKRLGNFTFVYKDAAIMRDGTKANLEVIFDELHVIRENSQPTYDNEKIRIAYAGDSGDGKPLALTPLSVNNSDKHFAIRSEIKFRVNKAGSLSDEEESFFFTASDINIKNNSANIANDHGNQNYSESIEPMYGINSESDIYLPQSTNITDNPSGGGWNKTPGGYEHRFMVNSAITNPSADPYDFGLATVVRAGGSSGRTSNGFITRVWASSGPDFEQSEIHFMNYDLTHAFTSSSGDNGKIELWTDGQIHDTDAEENKFRKLDGGVIGTPYTYAVPHGKEVTYKMAPNSGYILDTLTVNGAKVYPTNTVYKENSSEIDYYEYTFGEDTVNENKNIVVTWKKGMHKVTLDMNGGTIRDATDRFVGKIVTTMPDGYSQDIPTVKWMEEAIADGSWITGPENSKYIGVEITDDKGTRRYNPGDPYELLSDASLKVLWQSTATPPAASCTITYKLNGGTLNGKTGTVTVQAEKGTSIVLPSPTRKGYRFDCWEGSQYGAGDSYLVEGSHTFTAKWVANSVVGTLMAKMTAKGKNSLKISWTKVEGAKGYDIFLSRCNHDGKKIAPKKVKTIKGNKTFIWTKTGLKKGKTYKAYVKAYVYKNGKKSYVKTSPLMHAYTGGSTKKYTNAKSVTLKNIKKSKVTIQAGKTFKIKAKVNKLKKNKKLMPASHVATLRYKSTNTKVASVNKAGKITAKKPGKCTIYVYAHNGVYKKVTVTVTAPKATGATVPRSTGLKV